MAYIGRQQDGFGVRSRFIYTATSGQTTFDTDDSSNALSYSDGAYVDVYLNGVLLDPSDYTATSLTSIVLDAGAAADDVLEVIVYDVFSVFSGTFTNGITASEATVTGGLRVDDEIAINTTAKTWDASTDAVQFQSGSLWNYSTSQLNLDQNVYYNGAYKYLNAGAASEYSQASGAHFFKVASSGSADADITFTTAFIVANSGNVGIGTTSITSLGTGITTLELKGNSASQTDRTGGIRFTRHDGTHGMSIYNADGASYIESRSTYPLLITTNNSEAMRIDSSGNVGIGKTPEAWASGFTALQIGGLMSIYSQDGETASNAFQIQQNAYYDGVWKYMINDETSRYAQVDGTHRWYSAGAGAADTAITWSERMRIDSSGNLLVGTTASGGSGGVTLRNDGIMIAPAVYGTVVSASLRDIQMDSSGYFGYSTSTRATKGNIEDLSDVSWLYNLNPVSFNRKVFDRGTNSFNDELSPETEYGLIAEDVEAVNRNLCFYNETEDGQELAGITYSKLITPLLKALQEANERIETLEAKVTALESA